MDGVYTALTEQDYLDKTAAEFEKHGINLHIDFGPDSIDYVTGTAWKDYPLGSGGNALAYDAGVAWGNMKAYYDTISPWRRPIFHYFALVANTETNAGGKAIINGLYGMINYTSAFMHELGHNLGLGHGGRPGGKYDETNYKPNYMSLMNYSLSYSFFTYSDWELPDLDENNLSETTPLDPGGLLKDYVPPIGSNHTIYKRNGSSVTVPGADMSLPIDYNNDGDTEDTGLQMDINKAAAADPDQFTVLKGTNDWDNLLTKVTGIGSTLGVINTISYSSAVTGTANMPAVQTKLWNATVNLSSNIPTCAGYEFTGWSTTSGGAPEYQPGDAFSGTTSVTLYATWRLVGTPLSLFVPVDKTSSAANTESLYSFTPSVTRTYTLVSSSSYSSVKLLVQGQSTPLATGSASTEVLQPNWYTVLSYELEAGTEYFFSVYTRYTVAAYQMVLYHGDTHLVRFDGNGGSVSSSNQNRIILPGIPFDIPAASPTRNGYTFLGWAEDPNAVTAQYQPGETFDKEADTTLYAIWDVNPAVSSFEPSGTIATLTGQNIVIHFNKTMEAVPGKVITIAGTVNPKTYTYNAAGEATPVVASGSMYSCNYTIPENPDIISGVGADCIATIPASAFTGANNLLSIFSSRDNFRLFMEPIAFQDASGKTLPNGSTFIPASGTMVNRYQYGGAFFKKTTTKPVVSDITPANGASNVAVNGEVIITFSKQMDKLTPGTVSISGTDLAAGSWSADGKTYTASYSNLDGGTHIVSISGFADPDENIMNADSTNGFSVESRYEIALDKTGTQTFSSAAYGYGAQGALSIGVSNTGNLATGALTLALSDSTAFTLSVTSLASIARGGSAAFTITPKTGLAAGTYTATLTVSNGSIPAQSIQLSFTVDKATGSFVALTDRSATYTPGLKLSDITLPAGYVWDTPGTVLNAGENQSFGALYTNPNGNFTAAPGSIIVNVAKAAGTFPTLTARNATYTPTLTLSNITLPAGYAWKVPVTALNAGNGQSYPAIYTDPSGNYLPAEGSIPVNVAKAPAPAITWPTAAAISYGQPLSASALTGGSATGSFAWADGAGYPAVENSGFALVFTPADAQNYDWSGTAMTQTVSLTVNKGVIAGVNQVFEVMSGYAKADYSFDLTRLLPSPAAPLSLGTVQYSVASVTNTDGVLAAAPAGSLSSTLQLNVANVAEAGKTAVIRVTVQSSNYADFTADITLRTIAKTPVSIAVTMSGKSYDGQPCAFTGTPVITNQASGDTVTGLTPVVLYESTDGGSYSSAAAPKDAGAYQLTLSVPENDPTYSGSSVFAFVIAPKQLIIKANDQAIKAGGSPAAYTYTVTGLVSGEALTAQPTLTCAADLNVPGDYSIIPSGAQAGSNYTIAYQNGKLSVSAKSSAKEITAISAPSGAVVTGTAISANAPADTLSTSVSVTVSEGAAWKLFSNAACTSELTNKTMSLVPGDNLAYLQVTAEDGSVQVYTLTVKRALGIVDKSNLHARIAALTALQQGDYSNESWGALLTALDSARAVEANLDASQSEVNQALYRLNEAYDNLEKLTQKSYFTLWGKLTTWEKTPLNWILCIFLFGWIWMAF